jgi:rhodanese-related sulfurtransferase
MSVTCITPKELADLCQKNDTVTIIDVTTPAEFREMHVEPARNVPLDILDAAALKAQQGEDSDKPLYVICRSGIRGRKACEQLIAAGLTNVFNVEGGVKAWEQDGLPLVRGKKALSVDRQMRMLAGTLVLTGAVLVSISPYWAILSGFVGAGLIFAGATDFCPMALWLAAMPWNRTKCTTSDNAKPTSCCGM